MSRSSKREWDMVIAAVICILYAIIWMTAMICIFTGHERINF